MNEIRLTSHDRSSVEQTRAFLPSWKDITGFFYNMGIAVKVSFSSLSERMKNSDIKKNIAEYFSEAFSNSPVSIKEQATSLQPSTTSTSKKSPLAIQARNRAEDYREAATKVEGEEKNLLSEAAKQQDEAACYYDKAENEGKNSTREKYMKAGNASASASNCFMEANDALKERRSRGEISKAIKASKIFQHAASAYAAGRNDEGERLQAKANGIFITLE